MTFPLVLLLLGGFLLGGAWSVWKLDVDERPRTSGQTLVAGVLLLAALMATAAGILRFF